MSANIFLTRSPFNEARLKEYPLTCKCSNIKASFFCCVGLGILETIIRGHRCPKFLCDLATIFRNTLDQYKIFYERSNLLDEFETIMHLIDLVSNNTYSPVQLMEWLKIYMKEDRDIAVTSLFKVMKYLSYAIIEDEAIKEEIISEIPMKNRTIASIGDGLCKLLPIFIRIYDENNFVHICGGTKTTEQPVINLFQHQTGYSLLYHEEMVNLDRNKATKINIFRTPFTLPPTISVEVPKPTQNSRYHSENPQKRDYINSSKAVDECNDFHIYADQVDYSTKCSSNVIQDLHAINSITSPFNIGYESGVSHASPQTSVVSSVKQIDEKSHQMKENVIENGKSIFITPDFYNFDSEILELLSLLADIIASYKISNEVITKTVIRSFEKFPMLKEIKGLTRLASKSENSRISELLTVSSKLYCGFDGCLRKCKVQCDCSSSKIFLCKRHINQHAKVKNGHKLSPIYVELEKTSGWHDYINSQLTSASKCIETIFNVTKECISLIESSCAQQIRQLNSIHQCLNYNLITIVKKQKINRSILELNKQSTEINHEVISKSMKNELIQKLLSSLT